MSRIRTDQLLELLDDPEALETLYRSSPEEFRQAFEYARRARPDSMVVRVWEARLARGPSLQRVDLSRLWPTLAIALICGALVRVPAIWLGEDWYYPRLAPSLVLVALAAYFWLETRDRTRLLLGLAFLAGVIGFTSALPGYTDSVVMALVHLPILSWAFLGLVFTGASWRETAERIRFLRYNGELLILGSLVALGGIVFSALTVGLFELLYDNVADWYAKNLGIMGAAAVPVAGTYLYDAVFNGRTGIASVLARVFAPLFLVMVASYLIVALLSGENPFLDRSFLIRLNGLLLVVLGMTVLSVAERREVDEVGWADYVNAALLGVTLLIDAVALSAVLFRLASFGFTPNRTVVLGANLVILTHLLLMGRSYVWLIRGKTRLSELRRVVASYLPVYVAWVALVVFVLPFVFRFE